MGMTIAQKILKAHLVDGEMVVGQEIGLKIDQTLTQDATGTMAYLQFEAMGVDQVKTERSVAYIDHNTLQSGFENADDHKYIGSVAGKHGIYYSKAGNGICHQVHLERFGAPGKTLIGSDSHTPTGGGIGMLAFGAGGLDVAVAMGGGAYYIPTPKMVKVYLNGKLRPWVSAKDIILDVLRQMTVKGGVGKIVEYVGEGVKNLSVPERATITNMGAELGATTSIFPSDEVTKAFLEAQGRGDVWVPLSSDPDAQYDEEYTVDLDMLEPQAAKPHMPDNVQKVCEIGPIKVNQCCIGSCTNSSYLDMMKVAAILKGKTVHPDVSLTISPGSKQVLDMLAKNGALSDIIGAGARILECACGPCIGMGQSPESGGVSLRTFNRNFEGRSGTQDAKIYLVSPETAAVSALTGVLTDPRTSLGEMPEIKMPEHFDINDNLIVKPAADPSSVEVVRGPNIKPFPLGKALEASYSGKIVLKTEDNITTDHILPAGAKLLPYRSNVPHYANYCFINVDPEFPARCKEQGGGVIIGGTNYGQGSSREHAALVPLYLGVKAVLCKSFARIHKANLVNSGILPLTFADSADYDAVNLLDDISLPNVLEEVKTGAQVTVVCGGRTFKADCEVSERQRNALIAGGTLNFAKQQAR
ncbi:MAG: aconitate hydratase [Eubacteriales bacterium]|nr:aconitate hydratase [Eubacteriales bacterium]